MKVGCWGMEKGKVMKNKKDKKPKGKLERITKALKKAGYSILEVKFNLDDIVNGSETVSLKICKSD